MLQRAQSHLDSYSGRSEVITFFEFPSAFNMIHLQLLREKLQEMSVKTSNIMHYWLPDRKATVCEMGQCSVWFGDVQYRSSTRDSAVSIHVHLVHLRLSVQFSVTPPTLIILQWLDRWGVQRTRGWYYGVALEESSASENKTREIMIEMDTSMTCVFTGRGCWHSEVSNHNCMPTACQHQPQVQQED